jgi:hypothetical protein
MEKIGISQNFCFSACSIGDNVDSTALDAANNEGNTSIKTNLTILAIRIALGALPQPHPG